MKKIWKACRWFPSYLDARSPGGPTRSVTSTSRVQRLDRSSLTERGGLLTWTLVLYASFVFLPEPKISPFTRHSLRRSSTLLCALVFFAHFDRSPSKAEGFSFLSNRHKLFSFYLYNRVLSLFWSDTELRAARWAAGKLVEITQACVVWKRSLVEIRVVFFLVCVNAACLPKHEQRLSVRECFLQRSIPAWLIIVSALTRLLLSLL